MTDSGGTQAAGLNGAAVGAVARRWALFMMNPSSAVSLMLAGPPLLIGVLLVWGSWPGKNAPR